MASITATNAAAEPLVGALSELAAIVPPRGPLRVTVDRLGNRARPGRVFIDASAVGQPWQQGALAHEYAHTLEPGLARTLARIRWWYTLAPGLAFIALLAPAAALLGELGAVAAIVAWFAIVAPVCLRNGARASQPGELQADARAAELLGPDGVDSLIALLRRDGKSKSTSPDWFLPHPNPHRRIAAVQAIAERSARTS